MVDMTVVAGFSGWQMCVRLLFWVASRCGGWSLALHGMVDVYVGQRRRGYN